MELNQDQKAELDRLNKVLEVAKRNGNQIFVANIEREIAAILRGEHSPLIADYLTEQDLQLFTDRDNTPKSNQGEASHR